jgi:2-polyprenyl-3-methyl-5-hydroxy-6-metoxy-1,4-benzoquinol methylase
LTPECNGETTCPCCDTPGRRLGTANGETVWRCADCGLWYYGRSVRNRPASDQDWYAQPDPAHIRNGRDQMRPAFRRQLAALARLVEERSILDAGCGLGLFLSIAAEEGWRAHGLERNPNAARAAREILGITLSAEADTVGDCSVHVLRFSHVLEHVAAPRDFVSGLLGKLAPGGIVIAIVPNVAPLCYSAVNALRRMTSDSWRLTAPMSPGHHVLGFTGRSLRRLFVSCGMRPVRLFDVSMGNRTFFPLFYDGLIGRQRATDIDLRTLVRYWLPLFVDNLGNPSGRGQWVVGYFRKAR